MDEQRVPDLEQMDEHQVRRFLADLFSDLSAEAEYELRHEDYVMEMPQSGERIRGRENMREFQEAYPTPPTIRLRRVVVRDGLWVAEGVNDYGEGRVFTVVVILELRDGKIRRDTRYYAEPFEAGVACAVGRADRILGGSYPGGSRTAPTGLSRAMCVTSTVLDPQGAAAFHGFLMYHSGKRVLGCT
jgi:hypothetical protein